MATMSEILTDVGIDVTEFYRDWNQDESAIKNWIAEGSLKMVVLECHQPDGTVSPVVDFPVRYATSGVSDAGFTASRAALARFRAKVQRVPARSTYRLFCTFNGAKLSTARLESWHTRINRRTRSSVDPFHRNRASCERRPSLPSIGVTVTYVDDTFAAAPRGTSRSPRPSGPPPRQGSRPSAASSTTTGRSRQIFSRAATAAHQDKAAQGRRHLRGTSRRWRPGTLSQRAPHLDARVRRVLSLKWEGVTVDRMAAIVSYGDDVASFEVVTAFRRAKGGFLIPDTQRGIGSLPTPTCTTSYRRTRTASAVASSFPS